MKNVSMPTVLYKTVLLEKNLKADFPLHLIILWQFFFCKFLQYGRQLGSIYAKSCIFLFFVW